MYFSKRNESDNGRDQKFKTAHRGDRGHDQGTRKKGYYISRRDRRVPDHGQERKSDSQIHR